MNLQLITHKSKLIKSGFILILLVGIGFLITGIILTAPGDTLYPLGQQFDKMWASRPTSPAARVRNYLYLAEQRMGEVEVALANAPQSVELVLSEWEWTIRQAIFNISETPPTNQEALLHLLSETAYQSVETMTRLQKSTLSDKQARLLAEKITVSNNIYRYAVARPPDMLALLTVGESLLPEKSLSPVNSPLVPTEATLVTIPTPDKTKPTGTDIQRLEELLNPNWPVSFPPGTTVEHPFPLDGWHGQLTCEACHTRGIYKGLPNRCTDCHTSPHQDLFSAEICLNCHQTANWHPLLPDGHSFLLKGSHLAVSCQKCHPADRYQDTPTTCQGCHTADEPHQGQFGWQCDVCHTPTIWSQVNFDHTSSAAPACQSCHTRPVNHYSGQCSACHLSTTTWKQILFDHTGHTDCQSCHSDNRPPHHYPGQCSTCHTSGPDWRQINFSHTGQTNCQSCHSDNSPPDHYSSQCSTCHLSVETWQQIQFNHTGLTNCQTCHNNNSPTNHYPGQCSTCHTSSLDWRQINFSHTGQSDCQTCHQNDSPANHYPGQCSTCHTSSLGWRQINFRHTGQSDCQTCHQNDSPVNHYPGQCSTCHTSQQVWSQTDVDHTDLTTDCEICHLNPQYPHHYQGPCIQCHLNTNSWENYSFDHIGQKDCRFCHASPPNHLPGQCDLCHTPDGSF